MKEYIFVCLTIISLFQTLNAQPFLLYRTTVYDTLEGESNEIRRINLNDNSELLIKKWGYLYVVEDQSQSFFIVTDDERDVVENWLYKTDELSNPVKLPERIGGDISRILYSKNNSNLYIFTNYSTMGYDSSFIFIYNIEQNKLIKVLPMPVEGNFFEDAFFSKDEKVIYFYMLDTTYSTYRPEGLKLFYFSTLTNEIIQQKELAQFGYPSADEYTLYKGRNGISVIKSYFINPLGRFFRIYNFDSDSGSQFIKFQGHTKSYFTNNGDYILLTPDIKDEITEGWNLTGEINIYNTKTLQLVKKLNLPPKGKLNIFDNYPNMIYYFLQDENRVISIDIDTLIKKYTLNLTTTGNGIVTKISDQVEYDSSSTVKLKAIPSSGYKFRGWSGDVTGTADSIVVTMNSNKNITATFVPNGLIPLQRREQ